MKTGDQDEQNRARTYRVQAVDRALDILDCFSYRRREMNLTDIARATGLNKTTAKRLASNLVERGYLSFDRTDKRYHLGMRLFELGGVVFSSFSVRRAAAGPMTALRDRTGLTVLLSIIEEDHLIFLDRREGRSGTRPFSEIGFKRPLHFGVLGQTLMAHLPLERIEDNLDRHPLERYTERSITDRDAFNLRLARIREDGYTVEVAESFDDVAGVAAPIRDYTRQVVAAVGVAITPEQAEDQELVARLIKEVLTTASAISSEMGYLRI